MRPRPKLTSAVESLRRASAASVIATLASGTPSAAAIQARSSSSPTALPSARAAGSVSLAATKVGQVARCGPPQTPQASAAAAPP